MRKEKAEQSQQPIVAYVVAMAENYVIGYRNTLPWHFPVDLRYFRRLTWGAPVIIGRRTWESIQRPLPGRYLIILSRQKMVVPEGCVVVHSPEEALVRARAWLASRTVREIFVGGGAQVYALFQDWVQRIYLTRIHRQVTGDTYFPELPWHQWQCPVRTRWYAPYLAPGPVVSFEVWVRKSR